MKKQPDWRIGALPIFVSVVCVVILAAWFVQLTSSVFEIKQNRAIFADRVVEMWDSLVLIVAASLLLAMANLTLLIIARRKQIQAEEGERQLARAHKATLSFMANLSHEIRTPVTGILGMTELSLASEPTVEQKEYLEAVRLSAESTLTLINGILDFSRVDAGALELEEIEFSLSEVLRNAVKPLAITSQAGAVELVVRMDPEVPDGLVGDPGRLAQVLVNLVSNALKFTHQGEVEIGVATRSRDLDRIVLEFTVRDTGIGVSETARDRIFEAFTQAEASTTREYGGTGLGLAICSELVRLMDGEIGLESKHDEGSTFTFTVTLRLAEEAAPALSGDLSDLLGIPVLVAAGNDTGRQVLLDGLAAVGVEPTGVSDARSAFLALEESHSRSRPFRLAVLDADLPDGSGLDLAERLRCDPVLRDTHLAVLVRAIHRDDVERAGRLRATLLPKPALLTDLPDALRTAMLGTAAGISAPEPAADRLTPTPLNVLLVDDNEVNRMYATRVLEKRGHQVTAAKDGADAVRRFDEEGFDVVLMDTQMPGMNGFQATAAIRLREAEGGAGLRSRIIALTSNSLPGARERCLSAGMDDFLCRPVHPETLCASVELAAGGHPEAAGAGAERDETEQQILSMFAEEKPRMLAELRAAVEEGDASEIMRNAHNMAGALKTVFAGDAAAMADRLEAAARRDRLDEIPDLLSRLEALVDRVVSPV